MLRVCATFECCTSSTIISPDHSVVSSLDLSLGHTLSWVSMWHFLHACSLAMLLSLSPGPALRRPCGGLRLLLDLCDLFVDPLERAEEGLPAGHAYLAHRDAVSE